MVKIIGLILCAITDNLNIFMIMIKFVFYLTFIVSVAITAAGIILTTRIRSRSRSEAFSFLLYFQVFIYAFGFYGLWGQAAIQSILSSFASAEILERISDLALLLGLPFLVFAWLMLIRFSQSLAGIRKRSLFIIGFLVVNFIVLTATGYFITGRGTFDTKLLIKEYFVAMNIIHYFVAAYIIHFRWKEGPLIHDYDRKIIAPVIFLIMIVQCIPLVFFSGQPWLGAVFIFIFFLGNSFLPVYFSYGTLVPAFSEEPSVSMSFDEFCRRYEISPRESDVISEICNGLSNKEISEKLFISLQTVKDHTHRIYIKTNVKSRVQLINLVKDEIRPVK